MSEVEQSGAGGLLDEMRSIMGDNSGNVFATPNTPTTVPQLGNATGVADANTSNTSSVDGSNNENVVNEQNGIQESLDKIFAAVIVGGLSSRNPQEAELMVRKADVFKQSLNRFLSEFNQNIFENEYAVLYSALSTLNVKVFTVSQLNSIMDFSADDIIGSSRIDLSKYNYNINGGATTDEEKLMAFKLDVTDKFNELSHKYVTVDEFDTAVSIYKLNFKEQYMSQVAQAMAVIMTDGLHEKVGKNRSRLWKGSDDCKEYYNLKIAILEAMESTSGDIDTVVDEDWYSDELQEEQAGEEEPLLDTGINEIDSVYGGMVRGNMLEVLGPPKGGKTTLIQWLVERSLDKGLNVAVWALEGTKKEWIAAIVSLMVRRKEGIYISKRNVMKRIYKDERVKQAVLAAKSDLALSIKRGKLSFLGKACYIETMRADLNNHWKNVNAFDVIVMDSPILALSLRGKSKTDTAAECYTTLKHYISYELPTKALALVTCQLKQEVIDNLRNDPTAEIDVTAGGVTAESIRTPDFVVGLISTKQERKMSMVKLQDVASRHSESFDSFYVKAELGCCYFESDPDLNNK